MRVAVSADHRGRDLSEDVVRVLRELGHEVVDLRPAQVDPQDDYPDRAQEVGTALQRRQADRGILVCGSGVGACVAANKMKGIRAAVCHDTYSARQGVEHDKMNVLCLGSLIVGSQVAGELVRAFCAAAFTNEARHVRRLKKVETLEAGG